MLSLDSSQVHGTARKALGPLEASTDELPPGFRINNRNKFMVVRNYYDRAFQNIEANHHLENLKFRRTTAHDHIRALDRRVAKGVSPSLTTAINSLRTFPEQSFPNELPHPADIQVTASEILDTLRKKLSKSKVYRLSIYYQQEKRATTKLLSKAIIPNHSSVASLRDSIGDKIRLVQFCCSSKEDSLCFQDFLQDADPKTVDRIGQIFSESLDILVTDKFGNYTVQKLCHRHGGFMDFVSAYLSNDFEALIDNEYASRVMQALVDLSPKFRLFCLRKFKSCLPGILTSISAVFLMSAVIKSTKEFGELAFLRNMLSKNPSLLECRYLKRVMVSYVDNCPDLELAEIIKALNFRKNLCTFLDDKYSAYIVLMLVQRGDQGTIEELIATISCDPVQLFDAKFTGFLLTKILELNDAQLVSAILTTLISVSPADFRRLVQSTSIDTGYFLMYLLLSIKPLARQQVQHVQNLLDTINKPTPSVPVGRSRSILKKVPIRPPYTMFVKHS